MKEKSLWEKIVPKNSFSLCFHSAVLYNSKIYTFCGNNQIPEYSPPLIFNLENFEWELFVTQNLPAKRSSCSVFAHKNMVYLIGNALLGIIKLTKKAGLVDQEKKLYWKIFIV
jgi:hypothetical protein